MDIAFQVLSYFGGVAAFAAGVVFLCKKLVIHRLSKDLEAFKDKLTLVHEKEMQSYRHHLELEAHEHQIRFQQVATQRHLGLIAIHQKTRLAVTECYKALRSDGDQFVPAALSATAVVQEAIDAQEIFLPLELVEKWRGVLGSMYAALIDLRDARQQETPDFAADRERLKKAVDDYLEPLRALNHGLAADIRSLIGVEDILTKKRKNA